MVPPEPRMDAIDMFCIVPAEAVPVKAGWRIASRGGVKACAEGRSSRRQTQGVPGGAVGGESGSDAVGSRSGLVGGSGGTCWTAGAAGRSDADHLFLGLP